MLRATSSLALDLGYLVLPSLNKGIIIIIMPSYDQPCCVSEEPGAREEQPIYLTLTLHRKVRKPEFK